MKKKIKVKIGDIYLYKGEYIELLCIKKFRLLFCGSYQYGNKYGYDKFMWKFRFKRLFLAGKIKEIKQEINYSI